MQFNLDYFYGNEPSQFRFYRVPKALFDGDLSLEAVTLYGMMLDRVGLSAKNGWMDSLGRVFIYFVQKDVQKFLRCGHNRATAFMRELERFGLIERKRQGLGKPAKIYVKNFSGGENNASENAVSETVELDQNVEKVSAVQQEDASNQALFSATKRAVKTAQAGQSRVPAKGSLDCPNWAANETEMTETELTETNRILPQPPRAVWSYPRCGRNLMDEMEWIREEIRENIRYDDFVRERPWSTGQLDEMVELMVEAVCSKKETIRVAGNDFPQVVVKSRLLKLDGEHIRFVFDCLKENTTQVRNMKQYLLTVLYNAPATIENHYAAQVNHDLYGGGSV